MKESEVKAFFELLDAPEFIDAKETVDEIFRQWRGENGKSYSLPTVVEFMLLQQAAMICATELLLKKILEIRPTRPYNLNLQPKP